MFVVLKTSQNSFKMHVSFEGTTAIRELNRKERLFFVALQTKEETYGFSHLFKVFDNKSLAFKAFHKSSQVECPVDFKADLFDLEPFHKKAQAFLAEASSQKLSSKKASSKKASSKKVSTSAKQSAVAYSPKPSTSAAACSPGSTSSEDSPACSPKQSTSAEAYSPGWRSSEDGSEYSPGPGTVPQDSSDSSLDLGNMTPGRKVMASMLKKVLERQDKNSKKHVEGKISEIRDEMEERDQHLRDELFANRNATECNYRLLVDMKKDCKKENSDLAANVGLLSAQFGRFLERYDEKERNEAAAPEKAQKESRSVPAHNARKHARSVPAQEKARSDPAQKKTRKSASEKERNEAAAPEKARSDPAQEKARSDPVQEKARSDPAQEKAKSDPAQEKARSDPAQKTRKIARFHKK